MTTVLITWTDRSHNTLEVQSYELGLVGCYIYENDREWSFLPYVNLRSLDFLENDNDSDRTDA